MRFLKRFAVALGWVRHAKSNAQTSVGTIGWIVAFHPGLWIGLFSDDAEVAGPGTLYLRIVGPAYLLFGLGLGLFYVTLGVGRAIAAINANAVRMVVSASGGLAAIYWLISASPGSLPQSPRDSAFTRRCSCTQCSA